MSTLLITLPRTPLDHAAVVGYVLTPDGRSVAAASEVPLALLPPLGQADEVVVVVPVQQLSWHQVSLPQGTLGRRFFQEGSTQRLRAVLDGLLEDRLLDDMAQLHLAIEPQPRADAPVWVAVCDRAWLQAGLNALEQAGRPASRIVPEMAPDALADTLYVMGTPEDARMVFTARGGVAVWPLCSASVALLNWPEGQLVQAEPAVAALAEQLFKRHVTLQQGAPQRLQALASAWDLAQFELVSSRRARRWKHLSAGLRQLAHAPHWRAARVALLALLLVNLAGVNLWAWQEQSRQKAQRSALNKVLTSSFPAVQVVVDAPLQMAREVALLQQTSGASSARDLDVMLSTFGALAPANTVPSAIEFVAGELRLGGLKLTPEDAAALSFKLRPQGYQARTEGDRLVIKQESGP
jgi:general secretion pathway protein L